MHVYCVPRGVKRHDIVKEISMFALWSLESDATHVKDLNRTICSKTDNFYRSLILPLDNIDCLSL